MYLAHRIYVRFIRQQERQSFSVSILGSYQSWGTTALHRMLKFMFSCAKIVDYMKIAMLKSPSSLSISYKYSKIINCCTLSAAFMSALFASRSARISVCPSREAIYAGVVPSCIQDYREQY
jgi:hypothetical protein